ncbi:zinc ABC transporter ATP-binding protein AztA [Zhihengliuella salsuginis]|uniref:ABC transporter ATP-binding protein n=1 Tax=Zhihengliuella salsuginis TaxID=578222 RepID=A0ABQ3GGP2_9MICC|nr:zinc ABC transporter ATP-binding protein AztA [Zhihengliuella salsuginis]GHD05586.1 ABC transporter ATP-binding protein [Zhihengliuella salsuginis]
MVTTPPSLSARGLCFAYDGHDVLHDVGLELPPGTVTAIAGPNGSGKSTLIEILAGVRTPRAGRVDADTPVALVLQRPAAPESLPVTVHDVVAMGTWGRSRRRDARAAIAEAIAAVDLAGFERRPLAGLSGGQRQRAMLAQGIVQDARVLLLDEPAANLDAASRERTRQILADQAAAGRAVACVSHDEASIAAADRVVRLEAGRRVGASTTF